MNDQIAVMLFFGTLYFMLLVIAVDIAAITEQLKAVCGILNAMVMQAEKLADRNDQILEEGLDQIQHALRR